MFILLNGLLGDAEPLGEGARDVSEPLWLDAEPLEPPCRAGSSKRPIKTDSYPPRKAGRLVCHCGETFSRPENLNRHAKSKHRKNKWSCHQCGRDFNRSDLLKRHYERLHPDLPPESRVKTAQTVDSSPPALDDNPQPDTSFRTPESVLLDSLLPPDLAPAAIAEPLSLPAPDWLWSSTTSAFESSVWDTCFQDFLDNPDQWSLQLPTDGGADLQGQLPTPESSLFSLDSGASQPRSPRSTEPSSLLINQQKLDEIHAALGVPHSTLSLTAFNSYLSAYFAHFQPQLPVLHVPTFASASCDPLLLASMACVGACYSAAHTDGLTLFWRLRPAFFRALERDTVDVRSTSFLHAFLLIVVVGVFIGDRKAYELSEASRGIIMNLCRRAGLLNSVGLLQHRDDKHPLEKRWRAWIALEERKRLGVAVCLVDTLFPCLFDLPAYSSLGDMVHTVLPCDECYWEARTAKAWSGLLGFSPIPPSPLFASCATSLINLETCLPRLNSFSSLLCISSLHHHIFRFRTDVSLSAISESPGPHGRILPLSAEFRFRQAELRRSLDAWKENNVSSSELAVSAQTLYHLGHISLSISVADLYSVIGKKGPDAARDIAQDLDQWANTDDAMIAVQHSLQVLELQSAAACESLYFALAVFVSTLCLWAYHRHVSGELRQDNSVLREVARMVDAQLDLGDSFADRLLGWSAALLLAKGRAWRLAGAFAAVLRGMKQRKEG